MLDDVELFKSDYLTSPSKTNQPAEPTLKCKMMLNYSKVIIDITTLNQPTSWTNVEM